MDFGAKMLTGLVLGAAALGGMKAGSQLKKKLFSAPVKTGNIEDEDATAAQHLSNDPKPVFGTANKLTTALSAALSFEKKQLPSSDPASTPKNKR
jgi:hypothetical protein